MKFIITFIWIIVILSIATKNLNKIKVTTRKTLRDYWNEYFKDSSRASIPCKTNEDEFIDISTGQEVAQPQSIPGSDGVSFPTAKINKYEKKMIGFGQSAYFFDHLDNALLDIIVKKFKDIYTAAKALQPAAGTYDDPYSVDKLVGGSSGIDSEAANLDKLKKVSPTFDETIWKNSISAAQIDLILKDWKWFKPQFTADPAKKVIDRFDFNGDGRLSVSEFIVAAIINNDNVLYTGGCTNCINEITNDVIDPMFTYFDCNNDGRLTADEMYKMLPNLIRKNPENYNMFSCVINGVHLRTNSINDFLLKARKGKNKLNSNLTKQEFKKGILLGYWLRQTDNNEIFSDARVDVKNLKQLRWLTEKTDKACEALLIKLGLKKD